MEEVLEEFVLALRRSGVRISVAECVDAMRAVDLVGYADRQLLRGGSFERPCKILG